MNPSYAKPTLQAPLTGQALRQSLSAPERAEWNAYAQALKVAGYHVDAAGLAEQLLRNGCASVRDAFGQEVFVHVRVPQAAPTDAATLAPQPFQLAC